MDECAICGRRGVSLLWAHHKERGGIWICADCWKKLYEDNMLVYGSGESGCSC